LLSFRKIIVITGPTGTGKTLIADTICQMLGNGEIISADSRQIYKHLEIGTNLTYTRSPQHLISFLELDQNYSAQEFTKDATSIINKLINSDDKSPLIVGGTGLYLKALFEGGLTPLPEGNAEIRKQLNTLSTEELYEQLLRIDEPSARKNRHNPQRLKRALEIYKITGRTMTDIIKENENPGLSALKIAERKKYLTFGLYYKDKNLYKSIITDRTDKMLKGKRTIIEEALYATEKLKYPRTAPAFSSIGYRATFNYIDGKISLQKLKETIISDTLKYAKRQLTWFRHQTPPDIWIELSEFTTNFDPRKIAEQILDTYSKWKE